MNFKRGSQVTFADVVVFGGSTALHGSAVLASIRGTAYEHNLRGALSRCWRRPAAPPPDGRPPCAGAARVPEGLARATRRLQGDEH